MFTIRLEWDYRPFQYDVDGDIPQTKPQNCLANLTKDTEINFITVALLAMIGLLAVQSFMHNAILFIDTSNNA